jgi:agmatine/peptidylarginine deiminase
MTTSINNNQPYPGPAQAGQNHSSNLGANSNSQTQQINQAEFLKLFGDKNEPGQGTILGENKKAVTHKKKASKGKKFRLVKVESSQTAQAEDQTLASPNYSNFSSSEEEVSEHDDPEMNYALGVRLQDVLQDLID